MIKTLKYYFLIFFAFILACTSVNNSLNDSSGNNKDSGGDTDTSYDTDSYDDDSDSSYDFDSDSDTFTASGKDLDDCFLDLPPSGNSFLQVQDLKNTQKNIYLRLATQPGDRQAVGETFPYDLVRFGITRNGKTICIDNLSNLQYDFGHHNWNELARATSDNSIYAVSMILNIMDSKWEDTLNIYELDGTTLLEGPITLEDAGCMSIPFDLNPCLWRNRTDD